MTWTLTYTATVYDGGAAVGTASASFRVAYADCDAWFVDLARPTNSLELTIESMRELAFGIPVGVHRVLDRPAPVLTSLPAWTPTTELIVLDGHARGARPNPARCSGRGYPFLLRTDPAQGIGSVYFGVTEFVEERILTSGYAAQRRFRAACVEVERPDPFIYVPLAPNTYANVKAHLRDLSGA